MYLLYNNNTVTVVLIIEFPTIYVTMHCIQYSNIYQPWTYQESYEHNDIVRNEISV